MKILSFMLIALVILFYYVLFFIALSAILEWCMFWGTVALIQTLS